MKTLVVGGGSMGKRRVRCLLANGIKPEEIRMVDIRADRQAEVKERYHVDSVDDLNAGLAWNPDAVIVSVPGSAHMEVNLAALRRGKHVFCEVPLALNLDGLDELRGLVEKSKLVFASGCQPPLHVLFKQVKQWLDEPSFGKVLCVLAEFGQYLPDWHPYEDYRKFYAADQKMGGGNFDVIAQEISLIYWLLNGDRAVEVICSGKKASTLEINANDIWDIIADTEKGARLSLHFDMIQRVGRNIVRVLSEQGTIEIDFAKSEVKRYLGSIKQWETRSLPTGYVYEQCYIDEIGTFLKCIEGKAQWHHPLPAAINAVKFLLAIQRSTETKTSVMI